MEKFDYLIVGAGLFGATFARLVTDLGKRCIVIDKREHIAGNCYTENIDGITVHKYGPHIFHTSNKRVWEFINKYSNFTSFINRPKAFSKGKLYSLPFNMNTFYSLWGLIRPESVIEKLKRERYTGEITNLEQQARALVGDTVYEILIKEYTEKQWGVPAAKLPPEIIKRLPIRYTFDDNYFDDTYQGIPENGYTKLIENMLKGIDVKVNTDFFLNRDYFNTLADTIVFTGCIDEFFDYKFGKLPYRSLNFKHETLKIPNYQGNAVVNYCDKSYKFTRIIEHKHFLGEKTKNTIITREYPQNYEKDCIPYYPININTNQDLYKKYKELSNGLTNLIFGGRLAEYKYMDMHVVIESAMNKIKNNKL